MQNLKYLSNEFFSGNGMQVSENIRVSNPKSSNRQILKSQCSTKEFISCSWKKSVVRWSFLHPVSWRFRLPPSDDAAIWRSSGKEERWQRHTVSHVPSPEAMLGSVHVPICQNSVTWFQSGGWEIWPGRKAQCGKHSIVSAMVYREWNNQELRFKKIILCMIRGGWKLGKVGGASYNIWKKILIKLRKLLTYL